MLLKCVHGKWKKNVGVFCGGMCGSGKSVLVRILFGFAMFCLKCVSGEWLTQLSEFLIWRL